jgi:hypothetical protein
MQSKKKRQMRTLNLHPSSSIRLSGLRERRGDPPVILKRDLSCIFIAQVDERSHRVHLSYVHCECDIDDDADANVAAAALEAAETKVQ